jgi:hypothetical protein
MPGHALPRLSPLTVHFTFQYSDTPDYPHGKRQRAREAGLWAVDPPSYFENGSFVRIIGPLYTQAQRREIERRFPEWSPQRHMALDAIQRAAVRSCFVRRVGRMGRGWWGCFFSKGPLGPSAV